MRNTTTHAENVLTADEVAQWLRVPKSTLYKLCQEGQIPAAKIGRHWRFDRAVVAAWLQSRMTSQK
jgi:excisionase family DNA binding protein